MSEKNIRKVAVYVRKSREDETDETLIRQQEVLIDLCKKKDWEYEIFREVGSSQDFDRPELQKMLDKIKLFYYDGVVLADLDRLSRNIVHFGVIKQTLTNSGTVAITPSKTYDFLNQEDDLFSDLQSVLAKNEYQIIKKRLRRGTLQSALQGNWLGKKAPVGYVYNRETKRLEPSEDAEVIQKMFQLYLEGMSTKDIAFKFSHDGVATTVGLIWTPSGVSRILNNIVYVGHSLYGKTKQTYIGKGKRKTEKSKEDEQILVRNTHTPLISEKDWERVQQIKEKRNIRPPSLKLGKHTFSGLIRCGLCGSIHSFQSSRGGKKRITSCQTRHYNEDMTKYTVCPNQGANVEQFELLFYTEFGKYADQLENYYDLIREAEVQKDTKDMNSEIEGKKKQIRKLEQQIKKVQEGYILEIFSQIEARNQIKQFKDQIGVIEEQIEELEHYEEEDNELDFVQETISRMNTFLKGTDSMNEREKNEILSEIVETINYFKTDKEIEIEIHWKRP